MSDLVRAAKRIFRTNFYQPCDSNLADTWKKALVSNEQKGESSMYESNSDALVFYGATGDLAYKKIFPSLHAMAKRGHLNVPVIGVSRSGWSLDQLRERRRDSIEKHGGIDQTAFEKLSSLLRYVDGDYKSPET